MYYNARAIRDAKWKCSALTCCVYVFVCVCVGGGAYRKWNCRQWISYRHDTCVIYISCDFNHTLACWYSMEITYRKEIEYELVMRNSEKFLPLWCENVDVEEGFGDPNRQQQFSGRYMMRCILFGMPKIWMTAKEIAFSVSIYPRFACHARPHECSRCVHVFVRVFSFSVCVCVYRRNDDFRCEHFAHLLAHMFQLCALLAAYACFSIVNCVCIFVCLWTNAAEIETQKAETEWYVFATWLYENIIYSMDVCNNDVEKIFTSNTFPSLFSVPFVRVGDRLVGWKTMSALTAYNCLYDFPIKSTKPDWISFPSKNWQCSLCSVSAKSGNDDYDDEDEDEEEQKKV